MAGTNLSMALAGATQFVAMADTMRPVLLLVFILALFGGAALALAVGKRRVQAEQNKKLSVDVGIENASYFSNDETASEDWLLEATAEAEEPQERRLTWQEAILGEKPLHEQLTSQEEAEQPIPEPVVDEVQVPVADSVAEELAEDDAAPAFEDAVDVEPTEPEALAEPTSDDLLPPLPVRDPLTDPLPDPLTDPLTDPLLGYQPWHSALDELPAEPTDEEPTDDADAHPGESEVEEVESETADAEQSETGSPSADGEEVADESDDFEDLDVPALPPFLN